MGIPKYWSGLSIPLPGYLPDPEIEPGSFALQADSLPAEPPEKPINIHVSKKLEYMFTLWSNLKFTVSSKILSNTYSNIYSKFS